MRSQAAEQAGVEVYLGHTRFTAPNAVEVEGRTLRFRKAVIATGSDPWCPPSRTADRRVPDQRNRLLTDRAAGQTGRHRRRSAGVRAGPGLPPSRQRGGPGQRTRTLLAHDEPEAGELIRRRFEQEGIRLHLGFTAVRAGGGRLTGARPRRDTRTAL